MKSDFAAKARVKAVYECGQHGKNKLRSSFAGDWADEGHAREKPPRECVRPALKVIIEFE